MEPENIPLEKDMSTPRALGHWLDISMAVWIQIFFTVVCIGFGILMIVRGRRQNHQDAMDDSDDSDASARRDAERRVRYQHCSLDEASDPDTWMEVSHHHDDEAIDVTHGEVGNVASRQTIATSYRWWCRCWHNQVLHWCSWNIEQCLWQIWEWGAQRWFIGDTQYSQRVCKKIIFPVPSFSGSSCQSSGV